MDRSHDATANNSNSSSRTTMTMDPCPTPANADAPAALVPPPAPLAESLRAMAGALCCDRCRYPLARGGAAVVSLPCGHALHRACLPHIPDADARAGENVVRSVACPVAACTARPHAWVGSGPLGTDLMLTELVAKLIPPPPPPPPVIAGAGASDRSVAAVATTPPTRSKRKRVESDSGDNDNGHHEDRDGGVDKGGHGGRGASPIGDGAHHGLVSRGAVRSEPNPRGGSAPAAKRSAVAASARSGPSAVGPPMHLHDSRLNAPSWSPSPSRPRHCSRSRSRSRSRSTSPLHATHAHSLAPALERAPTSATATSHPPINADAAADADAALVDLEPLVECPLCYQLLLDPVTLFPCGHSACRTCVLRSLDHTPVRAQQAANAHGGTGFRCFTCRRALLGAYADLHFQPPNPKLAAIIATLFPDLLAARRAADPAATPPAPHDPDEPHTAPIFVCSLVFPGSPCSLHIFEPRYRLMLRRVMEPGAPRQFGMCLPDPSRGYSPMPYGVMMAVDRAEWLPDGRSLVQTTGTYVFRVLESAKPDGYVVARIQRVSDLDNVTPGSVVPSCIWSVVPQIRVRRAIGMDPRDLTLRDLDVWLRRRTERFLAGLSPRDQAAVRAQAGPLPPVGADPGAWAYWLATILPIADQNKYHLLTVPSATTRLVMVLEWWGAVAPGAGGGRARVPTMHDDGGGGGAAQADENACVIM
ncbi:hypothetical protein AMAG_01541 [Allomyces macrogynus ATCC 38327]|uniref:RING-type domain-containing protein n=1 Tax=Allomyces macrogynus (strain ATCC 38327) TaxID=578462 RepID=A0A0L0S006_ALLM3|nr:hypothetical protein AMAG_01541 [Allomyces macrogynus ATCC 38327]|eukprot:KNE55654.1 hypothetical protein AMAG_01541 [Allomyces macrogynus ATCC 38327]